MRDLANLHAYQASTEGMIASGMFGLVATIADLTRLAESRSGLRLLAVELTDLELAQTEIRQLISRLRAAREFVT